MPPALLLLFAAACTPDGLQTQLGTIASQAEGRVGAAAVLLETGEAVRLAADERFPMQSVYKLPIGMAVLRQVSEGRLTLEQRVRVERSEYVRAGQHSPIRDAHPNGVNLSVGELLRYAVSESDGSASDVLLRLAGGPAGVMTYLRGLGVREVRVADTEKEIGRELSVQHRNWATPNGAVALLRALQEGRGARTEHRALLLTLMTETPTGAHRLKGLLPVGAVVAHKTGTSGTRNGRTAATNDIGLVTLPDGRHLAIAVFVSDSPASAAVREGVIAKIARAAWDCWTGGR